MMYADRRDAGRQLARALEPYRARSPLILALPRGGVPVAVEVAVALEAPLDLLIARKIGVPDQPELAMGAVVDGETPIVVRNEDVIQAAGVSEREFAVVQDRELEEIHRRRKRYAAPPHLDLRGRWAIVIDDGIATGASMRAALRAVRACEPAGVVLAVPVAARSVLDDLRDEADETVCLAPQEYLGAVGSYYDDFAQVSDAEVIEHLSRTIRSTTDRGMRRT